MKNFKIFDLALEFYEACQTLVIKNAVVRDQMNRASLSIVLNIAEGSGKISVNDRRKFYTISMGSLRETQALLRILKQQGFDEMSDKLAAHLYRLIQNPVAK